MRYRPSRTEPARFAYASQRSPTVEAALWAGVTIGVAPLTGRGGDSDGGFVGEVVFDPVASAASLVTARFRVVVRRAGGSVVERFGSVGTRRGRGGIVPRLRLAAFRAGDFAPGAFVFRRG